MRLNKYTQQVVTEMIAAFPSWFDLILQMCDESGALDFKIDAPSPLIKGGLWVLTEGDEVIVGVHTHHVHFTYYETHTNFTDHILSAMKYIQDIISDQIGIVSWYRQEQFLGSATYRTEDDIELGKFLSQYLPISTRTEIRFWTGKKDREILHLEEKIV